MTYRWERFCQTILVLYQYHGGTETHTHDDWSSSGHQNQTHDTDLLEKIQELERKLQQRDATLHQLKNTVQSKQEEIHILERSVLNEGQIKKLIRLCHPDRNTQQTAKEVTQWLLGLLSKKKQSN